MKKPNRSAAETAKPKKVACVRQTCNTCPHMEKDVFDYHRRDMMYYCVHKQALSASGKQVWAWLKVNPNTGSIAAPKWCPLLKKTPAPEPPKEGSVKPPKFEPTKFRALVDAGRMVQNDDTYIPSYLRKIPNSTMYVGGVAERLDTYISAQPGVKGQQVFGVKGMFGGSVILRIQAKNAMEAAKKYAKIYWSVGETAGVAVFAGPTNKITHWEVKMYPTRSVATRVYYSTAAANLIEAGDLAEEELKKHTIELQKEAAESRKVMKDASEKERCLTIARNERDSCLDRASRRNLKDPLKMEYLYGAKVAQWIIKAIERGDKS
jgi:hypothetical protein